VSLRNLLRSILDCMMIIKDMLRSYLRSMMKNPAYQSRVRMNLANSEKNRRNIELASRLIEYLAIIIVAGILMRNLNNLNQI
jgi:hypothetical protein